jgi:uncharacterized protein
MDIKGTHVLVTGASRGIGEAMAKAFAEAGANVSVAARSEAPLRAVADKIRGTAFVADLLDQSTVDGLIQRVEAEAGPIDILMNNAGLETTSWFHEDTTERIRDVSRLNFEAPMILTRNVLPGMLKRGRGHVLFMSSAAGSAAFPGLVSYSGTKAGLNNFAAGLRLELRDTPINFTVVAPGPVDTGMWDHLEDEQQLAPMLKRLRALQLIPKKSPEMLAKRTVAAVQANRRHVRVPRRLSATFWLGESPRRIMETVLTGVPFVPADGQTAKK